MPIGVMRKKNKVGLWIDKIANQPGTSNAIDFDFFARDPSHKISGCELKKFSSFFPVRLLIDDYSCSSVFDGNAGTVEDDDFIIACASWFLASNDLGELRVDVFLSHQAFRDGVMRVAD